MIKEIQDLDFAGEMYQLIENMKLSIYGLSAKEAEAILQYILKEKEKDHD